MPKYDFRCPKCGVTFEVRRPLSEATNPAHCPHDNTVAERVYVVPQAFVPGGTKSAAERAP